MQRTTLGRTGLQVSVMGLGCGGHSRLGLASGKTEDEAVGLVRRALDLGIDFIDTAEGYGTEGVVGKALAGVDRASVTVSTKVGPRQKEGLLSGAQLTQRVEGCLSRLQTDHVDILHLHGVASEDYEHCVAQLVPALFALRDAGKVRFVGITEVFAADPGHAMLARALADDFWDVMMVGFNLLNQSARERVLAVTARRGIGTLCMFAVRRALSRPDVLRALLDDLVAQGRLGPDALARFDELVPVADRTEIAYRFCRHEPGMDVVLSGTGDPAHLAANARSLDAPPLPPALQDALRHLFAGIDHLSGN